MLRIYLDRASKFLDQPGYGYEIVDTDTGALVCEGWSKGDALTVREDAKAHARRALQQQERARLAVITGDAAE